ncbi:hypothetical protein N8501_00680 [Synechococcus sp. AH-601-N10]|nr:hypothetical protein [Synechococcus sp. AH-601-N10]
MNFKRLSIATLQALGLGLMPAAALATTDTTTFTGTVPGSCTYTYGNGANEFVAMSYNAGDNTLSGESSGITVNCNFAASATLGQVTTVIEPVGVTTTAAAALVGSDEVDIITSSDSAGSSSTLLGNTAGDDSSFTVTLDVDGATVQGTYEYSVLLTVLDS